MLKTRVLRCTSASLQEGTSVRRAVTPSQTRVPGVSALFSHELSRSKKFDDKNIHIQMRTHPNENTLQK